MNHLQIGGIVWCDEARVTDVTEDPREAVCVECLKRAASYGAASAMRYAAVEAGATRDPELAHERDEAMRKFNAINDALECQNAFFCNDCMKLFNIKDRGLNTGAVSWCQHCALWAQVTL